MLQAVLGQPLQAPALGLANILIKRARHLSQEQAPAQTSSGREELQIQDVVIPPPSAAEVLDL